MAQTKTIVVTGGGKGIGFACIKALIEQGDNVVTITRSQSDVEMLQSHFKSQSLFVLQGDVSSRADLNRIFQICISEFNGVDGLVNNAGIRQRVPFFDMKDEQWEAVIQNNLSSCFYAMQIFGQQMVRQGYGSIVNIASIVGIQGFSQLPGYAASKAGMIGLSKSVAVELANKGVRVNVIAPGFVNSSYAENFRSDRPHLYDWTIERTPLGRWGKCEEIANSVLYLLSEKSSYITGSVQNVDGGWLAY